MTAWEWLKEGSQLQTGTAWELLTHPKEGGGVAGECVDLTLRREEVRMLITQDIETTDVVTVTGTPLVTHRVENVRVSNVTETINIEVEND